ncbi:SEC-C domain-containing protein [Vibrio sp. JC009]|uniref:YchJ family metal-binding protein n=1 Tax=Vibrio sp. JC009 TaxID=2912314 RepID=UPI0023B16F4F|nr:YchJ family metal-binding protein [Vibrio sp. JC009]WED22751.1 SEC-C domain-containing protein [Vibrio sp. JC009]
MSESNLQTCPCCSGKSYQECCQKVHLNHQAAVAPEQLMRARFCAHKLKLTDFVVATYHPSCNAEEERTGIEESVNLDWTRLEIIKAPKPDAKEGFVEFKAYMSENGVEHCMHERSRFVRENNLWYYIDGEFPEPAEPEAQKPAQSTKVGRNDPCPCGSGKKFKKCCG